MRLVYTLLWYLLMPWLFLRLWWRGRRAPAYRGRWRERLALGWPRQARETVWIHAVSVGETLAAAPMIRALLERFPHTPLVVTTTTPTGSEQVRRLFGDRVLHAYCPWDTPDAMARFFRAFRPRLVLVMETELWPNLAAACARRQVPLVLVNGRLSERSARGYRRLAGLTAPMLRQFTRLLVQTAPEAQRFLALGALPEQLQVTGSVKFDVQVTAVQRALASTLRQEWGARPVWLAASTHEGEDLPVLQAHRQLLARRPEALLVLVPRHPERFDEVAELVHGQGLSLARRSQGQAVTASTQVYLGDTMGELMVLFGACDVAFVGGSLVPRGGHNLLEPAAWGHPVLSGPHCFNFELIADLLEQGGGLSIVGDAAELAQALETLLQDAEGATRQGQAALAVVSAHGGALDRVLDYLTSIWPTSSSSS